MDRTKPKIPVPRKWFVDGFSRYCKRYLRKNFHVLAANAESISGLKMESATPIIVYGNHAGWWDPIVAVLLNEYIFPGRTFYAPIDAKALESYRVFSKLGFFGIELDTVQGARNFLLASRVVLSRPNTCLWITPEGRFADPRDHSQPLRPGLLHLSRDASRPWVIPLAIEYPFWEERDPEALALFGQPLRYDPAKPIQKSEWNRTLTEQLRSTQNQLAALSIRRSSTDFKIIVSSKLRRNWYDFIRALRQLFHASPPRIEHSDKLA